METKKNIFLAVLYFSLSTIITWWSIMEAKLLYASPRLMIISCAIAGAKWGVQIVAALLLLKEKKWVFIRHIAFVCLVGSYLLLPYCIFNFVQLIDKSFLASLVIAVLVMIAMYYRAVSKLSVHKNWFYGWLCCLSIAIALQLFVVFSIR